MPKLAETKYCTGCTACASACPKGCITMQADANGFLFPTVEESTCISCGLCEKACPVIQPSGPAKNAPTAYAAISTEETLRLESSSGGIFSEIAKEILHRGGTVFGAAYDEHFSVVHICVESEEDLWKLRGAKYAQSDLRSTFPEIRHRLSTGQAVLFSGTPCQVAGLKAFLPKAQGDLFTVDFVCHSVPSPMAWQEYVHYRSLQDHNGLPPQRINLRDKQTGWSRYSYSNLFVYADGSHHRARSGESLYMKLFGGGYISREACENCRFKGCRRVSDLTIGDFWGIWDIVPEMDDNKGTSVVLVQSERGATLLEQIAHKLVLKEVTLEQASQQNPAMIRSTALHENRHQVLQQIRAGKIADYEYLCTQKPAAPTFLSRVRQFLGRIKRKLLRK